MKHSNQLAIVTTTVESLQDADRLAKAIVDQSLAACAQVDGPIVSHYRWSGELHRSEEYRLTIKTTTTAWPLLKTKLASLHPYDEPQIVMIRVDDSTDGYRDWVIDQTT